MTISATIIADSRSNMGARLTTMQLCYPLAIHGEVMTHRVFSRNARSSRAVPTATLLKEVRENPWIPAHIGANQKGMQAGDELTGDMRLKAEAEWRLAARDASDHAEILLKKGVHKQIANRILAPFMWMHTIVTATEWDNFFVLRIHPAAEPHIRELASKMRAAMIASQPVVLNDDVWHLPYVNIVWTDGVFDGYRVQMGDHLERVDLGYARAASVARCARVSYKVFDADRPPTLEEDLRLEQQLRTSGHWSPFEHQATPDKMEWITGNENGPVWLNQSWHGNFVGWMQNRKMQELTV